MTLMLKSWQSVALIWYNNKTSFYVFKCQGSNLVVYVDGELFEANLGLYEVRDAIG